MSWNTCRLTLSRPWAGPAGPGAICSLTAAQLDAIGAMQQAPHGGRGGSSTLAESTPRWFPVRHLAQQFVGPALGADAFTGRSLGPILQP